MLSYSKLLNKPQDLLINFREILLEKASTGLFSEIVSGHNELRLKHIRVSV